MEVTDDERKKWTSVENGNKYWLSRLRIDKEIVQDDGLISFLGNWMHDGAIKEENEWKKDLIWHPGKLIEFCVHTSASRQLNAN